MTDKTDLPSHDKAEERETETFSIDPRFLEMLVCPQTRGPLTVDIENAELLSKKAGLAYPIRDSIPIMLPDEARQLSDDEINRLR